MIVEERGEPVGTSSRLHRRIFGFRLRARSWCVIFAAPSTPPSPQRQSQRPEESKKEKPAAGGVASTPTLVRWQSQIQSALYTSHSGAVRLWRPSKSAWVTAPEVPTNRLGSTSSRPRPWLSLHTAAAPKRRRMRATGQHRAPKIQRCLATLPLPLIPCYITLLFCSFIPRAALAADDDCL